MRFSLLLGLALLSAAWLAACGSPSPSGSSPGALPTAPEATVLATPDVQASPAATSLATAEPTAGKNAEPTATGSSSPTAPPPTPIPSDTAAPTLAPTAFPAALPPSGSAQWLAVASGLVRPIGMAAPSDGSGRLFAIEQSGRIRLIRDGSLLEQPFLDISGRVSCCGERGLLGLAFHPRYTENGFFYVNYTDENGNTAISRFQVSPDNPDIADRSSEKRLLAVGQPYPNHNGGAVVFGPDGFLYLGLGDGGSGGDPHGNGQSTKTLLGKILRIDVDGIDDNAGDPYAIPADNPFASGGGLPEIWAYGLRNPWRIAFDRLNGDLYIGDVGQNAYEEIDFLPAGSPFGVNFGWNYREGNHPFEGNPPADLALVDPVAEYNHDQGCSVTGGAVYRGAALPDWQGVYLYGDYCSGLLWGLRRSPDGTWQQGLLYETGGSITSFGEDEAGEVYLVDYSGTLYRLSPVQ